MSSTSRGVRPRIGPSGFSMNSTRRYLSQLRPPVSTDSPAADLTHCLPSRTAHQIFDWPVHRNHPTRVYFMSAKPAFELSGPVCLFETAASPEVERASRLCNASLQDLPNEPLVGVKFSPSIGRAGVPVMQNAVAYQNRARRNCGLAVTAEKC